MAPPQPVASAESQPASLGYQPATNLPYAGAPSPDGSSQALLISPTPQAVTDAVAATDVGDTQNLIWFVILALMAIPGMIVMTLIATVLIRR